MEKITSKNNNNIVEAAKLKQAKHRKASGRFLIEGEKVLRMALERRFSIDQIFFDEEKETQYSWINDLVDDLGTKVYSISKQVADKLASSKNPQGIFAVADIRNYSVSEAGGKLIIACENLNDPGNMGTIIRTADAVGVESIIISSDCVDVYNEKVIRASMGSVFNVKIIISEDVINTIINLQKKGYHAACGHLKGEDFFERKNFNKSILVIGNEANGITDEMSAVCDSLWKLPMMGKAESLNAAVAAGIMMYDIIRRD